MIYSWICIYKQIFRIPKLLLRVSYQSYKLSWYSWFLKFMLAVLFNSAAFFNLYFSKILAFKLIVENVWCIIVLTVQEQTHYINFWKRSSVILILILNSTTHNGKLPTEHPWLLSDQPVKNVKTLQYQQ